MFGVDDKYDLPRDVVHKDSLIEIIGRNEFVVENYRCLKEIKDNEILVMCKKYNLLIKGEKLNIKYYNSESMVVSGVLNEISFI